MSQRFLVTLESELFGDEEFRYDTLESALDGIAGLLTNSRTAFKKDGIERRIVIHVGNEEDKEAPV